MIDPELLRQRRAAEAAPDDPKVLYRYRVAALRAGAEVPYLVGDRVRLGEEEGRVLAVSEALWGTQQVRVRFGEDDVREPAAGELRIVAPHRPAVLLGEAELTKRLQSDSRDPHEQRTLETLSEVARRRLKEGVDLALDLEPRVEEGPDIVLRQTLTKILRSRPYGEVEVALLNRRDDPTKTDLRELPPLAAAAPSPQEAGDLLDRLEAMDPELAVRVIVRTGKSLVGAGGPGFATAEVRQRVAHISRNHPERPVRVALLVHAALALHPENLLVDLALPSDDPEVRSAAARDLLRRGRTEPVWTFAAGEEDPQVLVEILDAASKGPVPLELCGRFLELGQDHPALEERALLRLAECEGDAVPLLKPWLEGGREQSLEAALWCAGMLGHRELGDAVLARLVGSESESVAAVAVEALARLGHAAADDALDSFGGSLLQAGSWGEEVVDVAGLLRSREVDGRELLGRFLVCPPQGTVRRARALEAARFLIQRGYAELARVARPLMPSLLQRFRGLEADL